MADQYSVSLVGAMDTLWFHQTVLFSEPISLFGLKILKHQQPFSESLACSSSSLSSSLSPNSGEEISSQSSAITLQEDLEDEEKEVNQISPRNHSYLSTPSIEKHTKSFKYSGRVRRLHKSMSCKSLGELELEELKGFMDLGFIFNKEQLSPQVRTLVPGLQRLEEEEDDDDDDDDEKTNRIRPYLSEAWLIKKPDSPLLSLRIPRASAAADMKKHLRFWARAVASVIQQES